MEAEGQDGGLGKPVLREQHLCPPYERRRKDGWRVEGSQPEVDSFVLQCRLREEEPWDLLGKREDEPGRMECARAGEGRKLRTGQVCDAEPQVDVRQVDERMVGEGGEEAQLWNHLQVGRPWSD